MMLKFSGEGYGFTYEKHELFVDTKGSFSVEHVGDMTTIYYSYGYLTLKRESFNCEVVA